MTTNPDWPEIKQHLKPGQTALDRPDLVARVFKLKKRELIRDVMKNHIFGKAVARAHTIEFQKRGFPHAHIVFWLAPETGNHMDPNRLDEIICAEIPEKEADPVPFELVTKFMLHDPCGPEHPDCACMQGGDGFCRFNYPKDYVLLTQLSDDGYPLYRRRSPEEGGHSFETWKNKKKVVYTNADVVPYSKYLLKKFRCHINVEYCYSIQSIKYLFKYFHKGSDQSTVTVENAPDKDGVDSNDGGLPDEVLEYQTKRYVVGAEATWRLRRNELASREPADCRLPVHLPDKQIVYYDPSKYGESIDNLEKSSRTMLTAYFELNKDKEFEKYVHQFIYRQVPEHYRWDKEKKAWVRRKRVCDGIPEMIGRMYQIHPTQLELFSPRLLLNHVKGAKSFEDLLKVDGNSHPSFRDAEITKNLLKDDKIWIDCMKEEEEPEINIHKLRQLFVLILDHCEASNPMALYDNFKDCLEEDYKHKYKDKFDQFSQSSHCSNGSKHFESGTVEQYPVNSCLCDLNKMLMDQNRSLAHFKLPEPDPKHEQAIQNFLLEQHVVEGNDELSIETAKQFFDRNFPLLNEGQQHVFKTMMTLIEEKNTDGVLVFLDAPGGTEKRFVFNVLFSIPIFEDSVCNVSKQSDLAKFLLDIALGIIDEGPMLDRLCHEALDRTMKDLAEESDKGKKVWGEDHH
ncbi:hypothetical protein ACHAWF_010926, partial [Thalassiosira exigua]